METYYLIDFENVQSPGLIGCEMLKPDSHIIIFYTPNANKIDMDIIAEHTASDIRMIPVSAGKQSADMHIVSYLGYLLGRAECCAVIVSRDTDFDNIIKFWHNKFGMSVSRKTQINASNASVQKNDDQIKAPTREEIIRAAFNSNINTSPYKEKKEQIIAVLLNSKDKQSLNNALTRIIPSSSIPLILKTFKGIFDDLPSAPSGIKSTDEKKQREQKVKTIYGTYFKDGVYKEKREKIIDILVNSSTKQQINNELCKIIPGSNVSKILKQFKSYLEGL